ncbi:MAG: Septum site-determining protein MinD [Syntrophus sp. PtaB.Bin001]|nr:MAG: Septum site-determining protein MinD [Syntrophus sp. PtaB.Bin001]
MSKGISVVKILVKTDAIRKELEEIISSIDGFAIQRDDAAGDSDLLILEIGEPPERDFLYASVIKKAGRTKGIFFTSALTAPEILLEALKLGIKGFFPQPLDRQYVKETLVNFRGDQKDNTENKISGSELKSGQIITLFGSKGGVGTTTAAVNLAVSLASRKDAPKVALLDMNPFLGEVSMFLGIESAFDWIEVAKNIDRLDATFLMSALTLHESGLYVLPSPVSITEGFQANPQVLETMLSFMQTLFDYIIVDSGQFLDDNAKAILKLSHLTLLVFIPSLPCIINLKRIMDTFYKLGYPSENAVEIIANRSIRNAEVSPKEIETALKKSIFFTLPNDYRNTMSAINLGKPLMEIDSRSEIAQKFSALAALFTKEGKPGEKPVVLPETPKKRKASLFVNNFFKS